MTLSYRFSEVSEGEFTNFSGASGAFVEGPRANSSRSRATTMETAARIACSDEGRFGDESGPYDELRVQTVAE